MSKFKFYILSFTWGLPVTLMGCIVALILVLAGKEPKKHGYCYYFQIGKNWGGLNLGVFFFVDNHNNGHILNHEHGHAIQNCYFGILTPFVILIPSAIRYWYREYLIRVKKVKFLKPYDYIWFEGQATELGYDLIRKIKRSEHNA